MARIVNLYEAKTSLSRLVADAAAGEEIVICKSGKPRARLLPLARQRTTPRTSGLWKGKIHVSEDFDERIPEDWWHVHSDDPDVDPLNRAPREDSAGARASRYPSTTATRSTACWWPRRSMTALFWSPRIG
jgi:prevent-host-death family protein